MRDFFAHVFTLLLNLLLCFGFSCGHVNRSGEERSAYADCDPSRIAYLAAPKGLDLEPVADGLGDARGDGVAEADVDRGSNSSLRRPICGVGGVELFATVAPISIGTFSQLFGQWDIREVEFREIVRGRLQSLLSSPTLAGGPISPRRKLPKRLPGRSGRSPPSGGPLGRNLAPFAQVSSVSAGPRGAGSREEGGRRVNEPSDSREEKLEEVRAGGREERQSDALSETEGGGGSRGAPGGPSKRRRGPSPREGRSGRGPSRRQFPANLASSSKPPPPNPERSFSAMGSMHERAEEKNILTRFSYADPYGAASNSLD